MTVYSIDELLEQMRSRVPQMEPEDLYREFRTGDINIFDIRDPDTIDEGGIPLSRLVQERYIELELSKYQQLTEESPIVVYCSGGRNSLFAANSIMGLGFRNVYSLRGGFEAWRQAGYPVERAMNLTVAERRRYRRHLTLPQIGEAGQQRLKAASVAIVGAGGLGSPVAYYLAAAGVGALRVIDPDLVEESNLQRQILHDTAAIGKAKVDSAQVRIKALNPHVRLETVKQRVTYENAADLLEGADIVVDGSDNFDTRYAVNRAIVANSQTLVSASIFQFSGHVSVFAPSLGAPCYSCLFPEATPADLAPSCSASGVVGALAGVIGTLQALETIKEIVGLGGGLRGRLLTYDGLSQDVRVLNFSRRDDCNVCASSN